MKSNDFVSCVVILSVALATILAPNAVNPANASPYNFYSIDFPGATSAGAKGLNDTGQIVGYYTDGTGTHGFFRDGGSLSPIDSPLANGVTIANGINNSSLIVGYFMDGVYNDHGFLRTGNTFNLVTISDFNRAYGINDAGQIVGMYANPFNFSIHGFLYMGGAIDFPGSSMTEAYDINNGGDIVGRYDSAGRHGFLLSGGIFTQINFTAASETNAFGINDSGQIVGSYIDGTGTHGFLLSGGDFNSIDFPGATLTEVYGINNLGEIVGNYRDVTGKHHGFFATVPEPSTMFLLTSGLVGFAGLRRKFGK